VGAYATYQLTQLQVFVAAMDDLLLIVAALSALGALNALLQRSGSAPAVSTGFAPPKKKPAPATPADAGPIEDGAGANGQVAHGAVGRDLIPSATPGERPR
jgi:hypothetical protein